MLENLLIIAVAALYIFLNIITLSWLFSYLAELSRNSKQAKLIYHKEVFSFVNTRLKGQHLLRSK